MSHVAARAVWRMETSVCVCASEHIGPSEPAAVCIPMCSSAHTLTNYISIITVRNGSPHGKLVLSTTTSTLKRYAKRIGYLEWRTNVMGTAIGITGVDNPPPTHCIELLIINIHMVHVGRLYDHKCIFMIMT